MIRRWPLLLGLSAALAGCSARQTMEPQAPRLEAGSSPAIELIRIEACSHAGVARPFLIGRYEVTQAQYQAFIAASGYDGSAHPSSKPGEGFLNRWTNGLPPPGRENHPVCDINVHHARAYCEWLSKVSGRVVRLPTDAEWTLAAAGRDHRTYPWGNEWDPRRCNYGSPDDGFTESAPVGSFPSGRTPEGAFDMAGNIWEWTAEGHLRGGPWCMGPDTVRCDLIAHEDNNRCDDKFGLRILVEISVR